MTRSSVVVLPKNGTEGNNLSPSYNNNTKIMGDNSSFSTLAN